MKALSIKQPWASLIAHGIKDIENRTWPTKFRGRIYIHASAKSAGNLIDLLNHCQMSELIDYQYLNNQFVDAEFFSAIIGEVDIIDCVINHPSVWAEKTHQIGITLEGAPLYRGQKIYNWVLANAVLYNEPILNVKGKLSFWNYSKFPCLDYQAGIESCNVQCDNCKD